MEQVDEEDHKKVTVETVEESLEETDLDLDEKEEAEEEAEEEEEEEELPYFKIKDTRRLTTYLNDFINRFTTKSN